MSLLQYIDVEIHQAEHIVLKDVNLEVGDGELIYLLGKVGSGKSSLLKTIYGALPIASGTAMVLGQDMAKIRRCKLPYLRRRLGIVFQDYKLLTDRSVEDNLLFVLKATGWKDKKLMKTQVHEVLQQVGMENKAYKKPHQLSGGEQQRVAIARALLNEPEIILADEPTGNLDRETSDHIIALLRSVCDQGTAVVVVTHNLSILQSHPGIVYLCKDGRVSEVTEQYNNPIVPLSDDVEQEVISIDAKE